MDKDAPPSPTSCSEFSFFFEVDENAVRVGDVLHHLKTNRVVISGGRDHRGGAIITFPGSANTEFVSEEFDKLMRFVSSVPSEDVQDIGFTVVADMHSKDIVAINSLLRHLQRSLPLKIHTVYVLKPHSFWQKKWMSVSHKMNKTKYNFEVAMVSNPSELHKFVDIKQLTVDVQGELQHDQDTWIDIQMALESLTREITENGSRYARLDTALSMTNTAASPEDAETQLTHHDELKPLWNRSVLQPVFDRFSELARRMYHSSEDGRTNPDFAAARTRLGSLLEKLESKRRKLEVKWEKRRETLEQCVQWRQLESDADKLCVWIAKTMEECTRDSAIIGTSPGMTEQLMFDHQQLEEAAAEKRSSCVSVVAEATRLLQHGHYAADEIRAKSDQLQQESRELSEKLANRTSLLHHASEFHSTIFSFLHNVVEWTANFEIKSLSESVSAVECQIQECKDIRRLIIAHFNELKEKGVSLVEQLQSEAAKSLVPSGFGSSVNHVKQLLARASEEKQTLETQWQRRMRELSQGLALRLFEKEAQKVYDWLDESGFSFLAKSKDIGTNHSTALSLLSEHKEFESNAQVMNLTAQKLLSSSEDLVSSGQCNPDHIHSVADQLEERMHDLMARSEKRKEQLEMSVAFQKTITELLAWMDQVETNVKAAGYPDSVDDAKMMINDSQLKRNHSAVQTANTLAQGQTLINKLSEPLGGAKGPPMPNYYENRRKIAATMEELQERHAHVDSLLADRKMKLDICLVLRTFETAAKEHVEELDQYLKHCQFSQLAPNVDGAVTMLHIHNGFTESMEEAYTCVTETGHNLLSRLSESSLQLTTSSTDSTPAAVHVRHILDQLAEKFIQAQEKGTERTHTLEQCLQLRDYETNVAQVTGAVADSYTALVSRKKLVGKTLERAVALLAEHEEFEVSIETMSDNVQELVSQAADFEVNGHFDLTTIQQLALSIQTEWTTFAEAVDNRHSLLTMSHDIHRHHDDLTSRSVTLQKEFGNTFVPDSVAHTQTVIDQHKEQRDYFVQECDRFVTDANYLLDQLKELALSAYCDDHGIVVDAKYQENVQRVQVMLEGLGVRQRKTLRLWEKRHRILEQHQQLLGFMDDAKKITDWVYNSTQSMKAQNGVGNSLNSVDELIRDLESYEKQEIQKHHERTLQLMEKAAELQKYEHCDTGRLRVRMAVLNSSWQELEDQLMKHKARLKLSREFHGVLSQFQSERDGILQFLNELTDRTDTCESSMCAQKLLDDLTAHREQVTPSLKSKCSQLDSLSHQVQDSRVTLRRELVAAQCHALAADMTDRAEHLMKLKEQHVQIEKEQDERKRQERRRDLLLEELVETEDRYVKDMEYVLKHYRNEMDSDGPVALMGKDHIVLGNMEELLQFHRGIFLIALKEAGNSSEEVGKCFVTWEHRLNDLYLGYCKTKLHSEALLTEKAQNFLTEWQLSRGHSIALGAYLIKPVQRVTRYHLLLQELAKYCRRLKDPMEHLDGALQIMLEIPKRTNDIMNFSMVREYEGNPDSLGQLYHQDYFTVVDSKILRSKEKQQQLFFFHEAVLVCKRVQDQLGNVSRYLYRTSLKTRDMLLTEFVEGEPCKFCVATGKSSSETKYIFKAKTIEAKQETIKNIRLILQAVQPVPGHLTLERGANRRSVKTGKKKKGASTPTLTAALASMIGGGNPRGPADAGGSSRTLPVGNQRKLGEQQAKPPVKPNHVFDDSLARSSSDLMLAEKVKPVSSKSATLNVVMRSRNGEASSPETPSANAASSETRDRRAPFSSPSDDDFRSKSDSISHVRLTRAKVIRSRRPREAVIVRVPYVKENVGVMKTIQGSPPQKARSVSPPVLHRSSATAVLIPKSRSTSGVTSAMTSSTYSELPAVVDVSARRRDRMTTAEVSLRHSASDGDLLDQNARNVRNDDDLTLGIDQMEQSVVESDVRMLQRFEAMGEASVVLKATRAEPTNGVRSSSDSIAAQEETHDASGGCSVAKPASRTSRKQEWRRRLVVKRTGAKSLRDSSRNWYDESVSAAVQRSPSAPSAVGVRSKNRLRLLDTSLTADMMDTSGSSQDSEPSDGSKSPSAVAIRQQYTLEELMDTERDYVNDLAHFIHTYSQELKSPSLPDSLKGKYSMISGNIDEVYAFHMNIFLPALENAKGDVLSVAKCFSSKEQELLRVYVVYCENKPRSEAFLGSFQGTFFDEIRQQLGDRLSLSDYLIKPVQRIMKYSLLLKDLQKYSKKLGKNEEVKQLEEAMKVTSEVPKQANNAVQLSMIEGYEGNIHAVGELLLKEEFLVSDMRAGHGRQKKRHVFLLEQVIILASARSKGEGVLNDSFICRDNLKIKEIGVVEITSDDDRKFQIWTGKMSKPKQKYELQAVADEVKWEWVKQIGRLLSEQLQLMRALKGCGSPRKQAPVNRCQTLAGTLQRVQSLVDSEDDLVDEEDQWGDSTPPETIEQARPRELLVAAVSYTASEGDVAEGIISFHQGQEFEVVDQSNELWWLVRTTGIDGTVVERWVPASYLERKEDYENMINEQQPKVVLQEPQQGGDMLLPEGQFLSGSESTEDDFAQERQRAASFLEVLDRSSITRKGSFRRKSSNGSGRSRPGSGVSRNEELSSLSFLQRFPRKARCFCGSSVTLTCTPELENEQSEMMSTWTRDDVEIQSSSKYDICRNGTVCSLTIRDLELSDAAHYKCTVTCGDLSGSCTCNLVMNAPEDDIMYEELEDYYDLGNKLGVGRFSIVRSGTDKSSGIEYAAKIFKKQQDEVSDLFKAELITLSTLRHPRIVALHQAIDSTRCCSLILERIRGVELFEYIVSSDCLSEKGACGHVMQVLDALSFMHSHHVAHLDLKPENVMVVTEDIEIPQAKLIDFGSSQKITNGQQTLIGYGSAEFCAPEIIKKQPVSLASDVWSLGAITYTLLTGLSPFYDESIAETALNVAALKCSYQTVPWRSLSLKAKAFVQSLLKTESSRRLTVAECVEHDWIKDPSLSTELLDTSHLRAFIARRKWQRELVTEFSLKQPVSVV